MDFRRLCLLIASMCWLGACSGDDATSDASSPDLQRDQSSADGVGGLWPCTSPGSPCNAHDDCAINPICGDDGLCRPTGVTNCDDDIECTEDRCLGQGVCEHVAKAGFCAITEGASVGCYADGTTNPANPCEGCNAAETPDAWALKNGGACDDDNPCTKEDYCQNGECKGTDFSKQCDDGLFCTNTICDGNGGCKPSELRADACLVGTKCYLKGELDETHCNACDPASSQSELVARSAICKVDKRCFSQGELHPHNGWSCAKCAPNADPQWKADPGFCLVTRGCKAEGVRDDSECNVCDPTQNQYAWSQVADTCKIGGRCYDKGVAHPGGCANCAPDQDNRAWTVSGAFCLVANACHADGTKVIGSCGSCDSANDKYNWTPAKPSCIVGDRCLGAGEDHASGCMTCDATKDALHWSPRGDSVIVSYDFEAGAALPNTMSEVHDDPEHLVKWQVVSGKRAKSGNHALYYGNPLTGDYDNGRKNTGTLTIEQVSLPAGGKAGITFSIYFDIEITYTDVVPQSDIFEFRVKGTTTPLLLKPGLNQNDKFEKWLTVDIDLSAHAGKTIDLEFAFDTIESWINDGEGIYIDDIAIYGGCAL